MLTSTEKRIYKIGATMKGFPDDKQAEHIQHAEVLSHSTTPYHITPFERVVIWVEKTVLIHMSPRKARPGNHSYLSEYTDNLLDQLERQLQKNPIERARQCSAAVETAYNKGGYPA